MNPVTLRNMTTAELIRLGEESPDPIAHALASRVAQAVEDAREEGREGGYLAGYEAAEADLA